MTTLRSAIFNLVFYLSLVIWTLAGCVASLFGTEAMERIQRSWAGLNILALRLICGIRIVVNGMEELPRGGVIIASQHQSALDTFIWMWLAPQTRYVVKRELSDVPVYGWLMRRIGHIPVDRAAGASALRGLLKQGAETIAAGYPLVIFPEGTRVAAGVHAPLQPGVAALAARTGAPVVPVATDSGYCWGRNAFLKRAGTVHVMIRPVLPQGLARPALMEALQASWDAGQEKLNKSVDKSVSGVSGRAF